MACNVFGSPITDLTLKEMPGYLGRRDKRDRAIAAVNMKNVGQKDVNALTYVEDLKKKHGDGISTLCLVYNATGDTITYCTSKDWCGHIGQHPYPSMIANGQWGVFLHVSSFLSEEGSVGTVIYSGKNRDSTDNWVLAWSNNGMSVENRVYTEIRGGKHYVKKDDWIPIMYDKLNKSGMNKSAMWGGYSSIISAGSGNSPIVEAILMFDKDESDFY